MFTLSKPEPVWIELIPARDDTPAVRVKLPAQPSPIGLRKARLAVATELRSTNAEKMTFASEEFSRALIRYSILGWEGIGDGDGEVIEPTHDREVLDEHGSPTGQIEPGTISAFLAEPRFFITIDRDWVFPWVERDLEKNGSAPSPAGTGAGATPDKATAQRSATGRKKGGANPKKVRKVAPTSSTSSGATKAKRPGR